MKTTEFSITSGSDVQIDQDSCTPADWFLNRIVRQSSVKSEPGACLQYSYTALRTPAAQPVAREEKNRILARDPCLERHLLLAVDSSGRLVDLDRALSQGHR